MPGTVRRRGDGDVTRPSAIVVGTGAGGATAARELQGDFEVTVVEEGGAFAPLERSLRSLERVRAAGLLFDEREIQLLFPPMRIRKTDDQVLVNGRGLGGTTTIATGNALRMDAHLRAIGIDLGTEFAALEAEIPISTAHQAGWREVTRRLFAMCEELGLEPFPTPKLGDYARCGHCGRCVFGCPRGVKWDSRAFLDDAVARGARLETGCRVERVTIIDGRATGVWAKQGRRRRHYSADLVILAAGGFGTPAILDRSSIACERRLFVDPVVCVAARLPGCRQCFEVQMPFVVQRAGFIVSPYFDYLSFFFDRRWRLPAEDVVSLMVKAADEETGAVVDGSVRKSLTERDRARLDEGAELCKLILSRMGIAPDDTFRGTVNAGHPGGTLPLSEREAVTLHHDRLPPNLYVADASLLPRALGNPPMLTIMALAKRVAAICRASVVLPAA
jgi:choline dehydrogenase-like flavoprotein